MSQYENYSDEKLEEHRMQIAIEMDKRAKQRVIPDQIAQFARDFINNGGDKADLLKIVKDSDKAEETTPPAIEEVPEEATE